MKELELKQHKVKANGISFPNSKIFKKLERNTSYEIMKDAFNIELFYIFSFFLN